MSLRMSVRTRTVAGAAVVGVGLVTALGACTSAGGGGGSAGSAAAPRGVAPAVGRAETAASGHGAGAVTTARLGGAILTGVIEIRTADITVAVPARQIAAKADAADAIALQAGGDVETDDRTSGPGAEATLVVRVPPDRLTAVLTQLSLLGKERSRHVSSQDVTAKVADVASRVASARGSIVRLRQLYGRATKVSDVIAIENELAQRESDLESLEAQQRALNSETSAATVTATLVGTRKAAPPAPKPRHRGGFLGGLISGWHAFTRGAAALATGVGAVLPFLLTALVIALGVRVLWPRLRRPSRAAPPTAETS